MCNKCEGDTCGLNGCLGRLEYGSVYNCSCHISAPCSSCVTNPLRCTECGWIDDDELESSVLTSVRSVAFCPRELDSTKIDYRSRSHTHFTMIKEGVYPPGTTQGDVAAVVRGTFGGRFTSFSGGKFIYIAYTD